MVDELASVSVCVWRGCNEILQVIGEDVPIVQTTGLVGCQVEGVNVGIREVQEIKACRRSVKVAIGKEMVHNCGELLS